MAVLQFLFPFLYIIKQKPPDVKLHNGGNTV